MSIIDIKIFQLTDIDVYGAAQWCSGRASAYHPDDPGSIQVEVHRVVSFDNILKSTLSQSTQMQMGIREDIKVNVVVHLERRYYWQFWLYNFQGVCPVIR